MATTIGGREYTDEEARTLIEAGIEAVIKLREVATRPYDVLVALAIGAVTCDRVLVKGGQGFAAPVAKLMADLVGEAAERLTLIKVEAKRRPDGRIELCAVLPELPELPGDEPAAPAEAPEPATPAGPLASWKVPKPKDPS